MTIEWSPSIFRPGAASSIGLPMLWYCSDSFEFWFNPLVTNDAYMSPIIECTKVPMPHICVKGKMCALTVHSPATSGQCLWALSTNLAILHLHPNYISALPGYSLDKRTCAKHWARLQSFSLSEPVLEEETKGESEASWGFTSLPTGNSLRLVVHTSSLHATTYIPIFFLFFVQAYLWKLSNHVETFQYLYSNSAIDLPFNIASSTRINCSELLLSGSAIGYVPPFQI